MINETNIDEFELNSFRSNISFVDQHIRLFNDTVKGNIAFGQTDSMPLESVIHAAKVSNSVEFIEKLDNQFDTQIGEDGITLIRWPTTKTFNSTSNSQRQSYSNPR